MGKLERIAELLSLLVAEPAAPVTAPAVCPQPAVKADELAGRVGAVRKTDGKLQTFWAEVYIPGVPDTQGDSMDADEIRKMAWNFLEQGRTDQVDREHDQKQRDAYIVESFIARSDDRDFIPGAWVVAVHVVDQKLWKAVEDQEINGLSLEGLARAVPNQQVELDVPSVIKGKTQADPGDGHVHEFLVRFSDAGEFEGGQTDEVNGHSHLIKRVTLTDEAMEHAHRYSFVEAIRAQNPG